MASPLRRVRAYQTLTHLSAGALVSHLTLDAATLLWAAQHDHALIWLSAFLGRLPLLAGGVWFWRLARGRARP